MLDVTLRQPVAPSDVATLRRIAADAEAADGHPSLGDSVWRDVAQPTPESAIVLASVDGEPVGALHVSPPENHDDGELTMAIVVDPRHRTGDVERALLDLVSTDTRLRRRRGLLWIFGADDRSDLLVRGAGFEPDRELRQMEVPLPVPPAVPWPDGIDVRPFRVGVDEDAWLTVNNRAFANDPDQQGWSLDTLERREREAWFDPGGFLLAWQGDDLAGFCWTRLHPPSPPRQAATQGEIYVIGVDPAHQGIGLGRALVVAGLESLHDHGATVGMLFVDAANTAAVSLYEDLGFRTVRVDRAYERAPG